MTWCRPAVALLVMLAGLTGTAAADPAACRVVDVDFVPADKLQIVAWLEDAAGAYVTTIYITQETGRYGLGNRPGRFDFNSGPKWPYGRRVTTFPVWSHKNNLVVPELEFQDGNDSGLSHATVVSSHEPAYCKPLLQDEPGWQIAIDSGTCASEVFTDKGTASTTTTTGYPPRADIKRDASRDSAFVDMFPALDLFDAVSQATPPGDQPSTISWAAPSDLPDGNYTLWVEVAKELDFNATYNATSYPSPTGISFEEWGEAYRGQPSVVYRVPIAISGASVSAMTDTYSGYGDPDGLDGTVRSPDPTITTDAAGTGASRLELVPGGQYRVRVHAYSEPDVTPPAAPGSPAVAAADSTSATVTFIAPGDDGTAGKATAFDIRFVAGTSLDDASFSTATKLAVAVAPGDPGSLQTFTVTGLLYETDYTIGIRAFDNCRNASPLVVVHATTTPRQAGQVDACFIATAAYGSALATEVQRLRRMRDRVLASSVLGELAIETYYTFGPELAGVIGQSELARATARAGLSPIVARIGTAVP